MTTQAIQPTPHPLPDWLARRDGHLQPGLREFTTHVMLGGQPQYRLDVRPALGKFVCAVVYAVNGKRLDDGTQYPTPAAAVAGGLEQLRRHLGW